MSSTPPEVIGRSVQPVIGLPAVLVYRAGEMEMSLIRLIDEIPGWAETRRCTLRDFKEYLELQGVLEGGVEDAQESSSESDSD